MTSIFIQFFSREEREKVRVITEEKRAVFVINRFLLSTRIEK